MADCRLNQLKLQIKLCSKAKVGLVYIKALLEHYTKYCGVRKDPQVTRTRAECVKSFPSASGQGSVIAEEHPAGSFC